MDKSELRRSLLQARAAIEPQRYQQLSSQMVQHLQRFLAEQWTQGCTVLCYWPLKQEPDLTALFRMENYQWGLPRCLPDHRLVWHYWQAEPSLVAGLYGLLEPEPAWPEVSVNTVSLLLVPALAMDRQGYRLGYGGGYFDRLLATPDWNKVLTLGVTFDAMVLEQLPTEDWDYPLQGILTESGIWMVSNNCEST